jgi:hypothetical protein
MFRLLRADEIDVRVAAVKENGLSLLLYKDARADMIILDEIVGPFNWKREHSRDNANCTVSIWDKEKQQWISKEDTGAESFTEKEKGLASDSFKRACFNWGIGRELYTSPFIWINAKDCTIKPSGQKFTSYDQFRVTSIGYDSERRINALTIVNDKNNKVVFDIKSPNKVEEVEDDLKASVKLITLKMVQDKAKEKGVSDAQILATLNKDTPEKEHINDLKLLSQAQLNGLYKRLEMVKK